MKHFYKSGLFLLTLFSLSFPVYSQNCVLHCKDTVLIALDSDCKAALTESQILLDSFNCKGPFDFAVFDSYNFLKPKQFGKQDIGKKLYVKLSDKNNPANYCTSILKIADTTAPKLICPDLITDCKSLSLVSDEIKVLPTIADNCSLVSSIDFIDKFVDLDCDNNGFKNLASPDKWKVSNDCEGFLKLVYSNSLDTMAISTIKDTNSLVTPCHISSSLHLDFEGSIDFEWQIDSLSNLLNDSLCITINNTKIKLNDQTHFKGHYSSLKFAKNDVVTFEYFTSGTTSGLKSIVYNFKIITNVKSFLRRTWKAKDEYGNIGTCNQHIFVFKNYLKEVVFPADFTDSLKSNANCGGNYSPELTAWPYLKTGKYNSYAGIIELKPGSTNVCLISSYEDKKTQICEGSYQIERKWKIIEACSNDSLVKTQLITILDVTPPEIFAPKTIEFFTEIDHCYTQVIIPNFTATDACSPNNLTLSVKTPFSNNSYGPFDQIGVGTYKIVYEATDACNNKAEFTSELIVKDATSPIALCKSNISVVLDDSGEAIVSASSIDNGSYDNCCLDNILIKCTSNPSTAFAYNLKLSCADVPETIVELSVSDCHNNLSFCKTKIQVIDNQKPNIVCPPDVTIDCKQDIVDLNKYGQPIVSDNCPLNILYSFTSDISSCNEGEINRSWQISDLSQNNAVCKQNIHVNNAHNWNLTNDKIKWPLDFQTEDCKYLADLKPNALPPGYGQPTVIDNDKCTNLDISYTDQSLTQAGISCSEIIRKWKIVEKCTFATSGGMLGVWEHDQMLKIVDKTVPELIVPADITVMADSGMCAKFVSFSLINVNDCDPNPIVSNSKSSNPNSINGTYQTGVNSVTVTASDHCGNSVTKTVKITVLDNEVPKVMCKNQVNFNLDNLDTLGEMTISASNLVMGYEDNCTPNFMIKTMVSPSKISCKDIGNLVFEVQVFDGSGNTATCKTSAQITDLNGLCASPNYKISGKFITPDAKPIANVQVRLAGAKNETKLNQNDGTYNFSDLQSKANFTIDAEKNLNPLNGVTTYDLLLLNQHILGKKTLDSPYKFIAADINQNNIVTMTDYLLLKNLLLLNIDSFPNGKSWCFIPQSFTFPYFFPVIPSFPESISINNLDKDQVNQNFIGVKLGDLNFSNNAENFTDPEEREAENIQLEIASPDHLQDNLLLYPIIIHTNQPIIGMQFELKNLAQHESEISVQLPESTYFNKRDWHIFENGNIRFSWVGEGQQTYIEGDTLMFVSVKQVAKNNAKIELNEKIFISEAYDNEYITYNINLIDKQGVSIENNIESVKIFPNPSKDHFTIEFFSKQQDSGNIKLLDMAGKLVYEQSVEISRGLQFFNLNNTSELSNGIYICEFQSNKGFVSHQKIIIAK